MSQNLPPQKDPKSNSADGERDQPKVWKSVDDGIWLHIPTGIYYERPTINGKPTYRSLKTRDLKEATKEFYRRRAKGDSAYQKATVTTVGEVIRAYQAGGYLDRQRHDRPEDTRKAEEVISAKLLEFWDKIPVAGVGIAVFDRYHDWRTPQISSARGTGDRTVDLELNTLRNAFVWGCRCEIVAHVPLGGRWPKYDSGEVLPG